MDLKENIRSFIRMEIDAEEMQECLEQVDSELIACHLDKEDWMLLATKLMKCSMRMTEFTEEFLDTYYQVRYSHGLETWDFTVSPYDNIQDENFYGKEVDTFLSLCMLAQEEDTTVEALAKEDGRLSAIYLTYLFNQNKPMTEWKYPYLTMVEYIDYASDKLNYLEEDQIALYLKFVDELSSKDDIRGLEEKAFGYYGGNEVFPCDWNVSKEYFLHLLDIAEDLDSKYDYANALGYIYYYGRCNNGIPEYEKAKKMFELGMLGGNVESTYKLSDMYRYGYAVEKDAMTAELLLRRVFDDQYEKFMFGHPGKLADIALRLGTLEEEQESYYSAHYLYLMAEYAIDQRMASRDMYGDDVVSEKIQAKLDHLEEMLEPISRSELVEEYPTVLRRCYMDNHVVGIQIDEDFGDTVIIAEKMIGNDDEDQRLIEVCYPEYSYYDLCREINVHLEGDITVSDSLKDNQVVYTDSMYIDEENKEVVFTLFNNEVARIHADSYSFDLSDDAYSFDM